MKVVYTDMVGDLFHYGHVNALKQSKSFGDYLIVGVHSNEVVETYKRVPVMSMEERIKVIESCRFVDKVIGNAPLKITEEYLKEHKIDIVSVTNIRPDEENKKMYGVPMELGIIQKFAYTKKVSTSDIINNIKRRIQDKTL